MKRPLFIIIGTALVFILLGVWIYILFFGTPKESPDVFTNIDFGNEVDTTIYNDNDADEQPTVDVTEERLRQLTTKPTIGYQEVIEDTSSTPKIMYIEAGTGNIFSINTNTGEESRVSKTTFLESWRGVITPDGKFVMLQSELGPRDKFTIGEISSSSDELIYQEIDENIVDFKVTTENTFLYAIQTNSSIIGKHYYPISDTSETIFTVPFRDAAIDWGDKATDIHYAYPKANTQLEGFLYQIKDSYLKRLPIDGNGLSAQGNDNNIIFSKQVAGEYKTYIHDLEKKTSSEFSFVIIPEKCVYLNNTPSNIICANTLTTYGRDIPDAWYRGEISYADMLWEINTTSVVSSLIVDIETKSGRQIDVTNLMVNQDDSNLYFTNKNDQTLWVYERIITSSENEQ